MGRLLWMVVIVVTTVTAWITAIRMRRRIKRALGSKATDVELTSIATWMKVEQAEERDKGGKLL
jgi:hypothetical protein